MAAAYQHVLEAVTCEIVDHWLGATGLRDVVLAGGVAANVKLNQRIASLEGVRRVFVYPNMGDGGTDIGAVLAVLHARGEVGRASGRRATSGPAFSDEEIAKAVRAAGLQPSRSQNVGRDVAICSPREASWRASRARWSTGRRALGNRSILCDAADPGINAWLNRRLGRTEFMPFAPVTLAEHAPELYVDIDDVMAAARFMTITCNCTQRMKRRVAGRGPRGRNGQAPDPPDARTTRGLRAILEEYQRLTGIPTLINTSFNMHEEPIVCSPEDAVRAFLDGGLDYLAMGPFLIASESAPRARAQAVG